MTPSRIPAALLAKYTKNGPRYTSYPTAPQFSTDFEREQVAALWRGTRDGGPISLYVHLPFCAARCLYCACTTEIGHSRQAIDSYLARVIEECERHSSGLGERPAAQVALGGGTPTHLELRQMRFLMQGLEGCWEIPRSAERSIEIDPRNVDDEYLEALVSLGFNRYSFGVQDFEETVQRNVHRVSSFDHLRKLLAHLRALGREAINLDLMYGLPGQTPGSFAATIDRVLSLQPSRVAVFAYAHVPWVSPHQKALEQYRMPGPNERAALFSLAYDRLTEAGYEHVGMDHFALPGDELILALRGRSLTRNFMGYTTHRGLDLVGVGASAISSVGGTYTQNIKDVAGYVSAAGSDAWFKALVLSDEDLLRRELILDLFCNFHVDLGGAGRRFGIDAVSHFAPELRALEALRDDGLLEIVGDAIQVTELGRFFIRNICMAFDKYLAGAESQARYSKTV